MNSKAAPWSWFPSPPNGRIVAPTSPSCINIRRHPAAIQQQSGKESMAFSPRNGRRHNRKWTMYNYTQRQGRVLQTQCWKKRRPSGMVHLPRAQAGSSNNLQCSKPRPTSWDSWLCGWLCAMLWIRLVMSTAELFLRGRTQSMAYLLQLQLEWQRTQAAIFPIAAFHK